MENQEFTQLEQLKDELIEWLQTLKYAKSEKAKRNHEANFHAFLDVSFLDWAELLGIIDNLDDEMLGILLYFLPVDWVLKMLVNWDGEQIRRIMPLLDNAAHFIGLISPEEADVVIKRACGQDLDCREKLFERKKIKLDSHEIITTTKHSLSQIFTLWSFKEIFSGLIRRAMFLARE